MSQNASDVIAQNSYDRFKELKQNYYLAGRSLLINRLFGMAGINFGYAIELSLKFLLAVKGNLDRKLTNTHDLRVLYQEAVDNFGLPTLRVSGDFLVFANERLNARYPSMIASHLENHEKTHRAYAFTIDMLHCYDDFLLQLDDAISNLVGDVKSSIGFRCCREVESTSGRVFFHCNDHAFMRLQKYKEQIAGNRDEGDNAEQVLSLLDNLALLWNFKGLMAYRPWGPKVNWSPAASFEFPKSADGRVTEIRAAQWNPNDGSAAMYLSSAEVILPPGKYAFYGSQVIESAKQQ